MDNKLSLKEARHMLSDYFEVHVEESQKNALARAIEFLDEMGTNEETIPTFGCVATMRVGDSVLAYLPEGYDPKDLYLVRRKTSRKGATRKIKLK